MASSTTVMLSPAGVDPAALSAEDASFLMSEEHKALGYRPPPNSLAAQAQSAVAKKDDVAEEQTVEKDQLTEAAQIDATRVATEQGQLGQAPGLENITSSESAQLESEEHEALSYHPPAGSLAAQAGSEAAQHPDSGAPTASLTQATICNANKTMVKKIDLSAVNAVAARVLMSVEHKALGFRPPPGSLAASAQAAAALHPEGAPGLDPPTPNTLREAAITDAERIALERQGSLGGAGSTLAGDALEIDLKSIGEVEARKLMSAEHKALGYRPPPGSLAAEAQSEAAKHPEGGPVKPDPRKLEEAAKKDAERIAELKAAASTGRDANPYYKQIMSDHRNVADNA